MKTHCLQRPALFTITLGYLLVSGSAYAQTEYADDYRPEPAFEWQTRAALADQSPRLIIDVLNEDVERPYGIAFLPDGRFLLTEQAGRIRIVDADGNLSPPVEGMPKVFNTSFSGVNDIAVDPDFATNRYLYFVYAPDPGVSIEGLTPPEVRDLVTGKLARARLSDDESRLEDTEIIFDAMVRRPTFASDGTLLFTTMSAFATRPQAQDLSAIGGKILRINSDGSIPDNNPFAGDDTAHPAVYTYGHRDPSGLAVHPETGAIWSVEHGPRGGDELNVLAPGNNYGWPVISYGREYSEEPIGEGTSQKEGMEQPVYFWTPSIAPGSLMFYRGDKIPEWSGNAFVSTLSGEHLARLVMEGNRVIEEERLFVGREQRIRTVAQSPDGDLYLTVSQFGEGGMQVNGQILRITPKPPRNPISNRRE